MRIAIFDNLANSAYIQAKALRQSGHEVDLVLDPLDRYVMSDPRWDELDLELPTDQLFDAALPDCALPAWVRYQPGTLTDERPAPVGRIRRAAGTARAAVGLGGATRLALRRAGWHG